jgi:lipopolysaccharide/colanic/teichoic acid biosynthesis glycosyltransferase
VESNAAPDTKDPMRHHTHYVKSGKDQSPYAGGSSFMERMAEAVASGMGTVAFAVVGSAIILGKGADQRGDPVF